MNILCLNTAFSEAHIALKFNEKKYFKSVDSNSKHSENLLLSIEQIFAEVIQQQNLDVTTNDILRKIDVISCVVGPGSFTGLRISISTAKALMATQPHIKAVAINSLELLSYEYIKSQSFSNNPIKTTPVLDALSELYFVAEYNNLTCITPPKMILKTELQKYKNLISNDESITSNIVKLTPENLLNLTINKIQANQLIEEKELVPLYLRPSQAEAELQCKSKK